MNKIASVLFMALCFSSFAFLAGSKITMTGNLGLRVHNADTGLGYARIQEAINANETVDGHTIRVDSGTYYENVVVNKSIRLLGEDKYMTIIDGNDTGSVVQIGTNNVTVAGFTIVNSKVYCYGIRTALKVGRLRDLNISDNIVKWNDIGIYLYCSDSVLSGNEVTENYPGIELSSSNNNTICGNIISRHSEGGLFLINSNNNLIYHNKLLYNSRFSIDLVNSAFNRVISNEILSVVGIEIVYMRSYNNVVANNSISYPIPTTGFGMQIIWTHDNFIIGNNISNFDGAIFIYDSNNTVFSENRISNDTRYGIFIGRFCNGSIIARNEIVQDTVGIQLCVYSQKTTIIGNTISSNSKYGIQIDNSGGSMIFHNNFMNNTSNAYVTNGSANIWDDGYPSGGNYWSGFAGGDLYSGRFQNETGSDGMGDNPYVIDLNNKDGYPLLAPIPPYYHTLSEEYKKLLDNYSSLNTTYCDLLATYNLLNTTYSNLLANYNNLQSTYNQLNSSYNTLQDAYNQMQAHLEAVTNELSIIRNLTYALAGTTTILIVVTVCLAIRKTKTRKRHETT